MTEETKALVRQGIVPIVLGNDRMAHRLSFRLYRTFGLPSILCACRRTVWDVLDPTSAFRRVSGERVSRLMAEQLLDLAAEYEDCLLLLIPTSEEDQRLLEMYGERLEAHFVCRMPDALWNEPMLNALRFG